MTAIPCTRCGKTAPAINGDIPWTGPIAAEIRSKICSDCWQAWSDQQVIVINELSLKPFLPEHRVKLEAHMREFLKLPPLNEASQAAPLSDKAPTSS